MSQDELSKEVRRLLREHIFSVEQLEILLLLRRRAGSELDVGTVSEEIRTSERSAAGRLADLEARGFLRARDEDGTRRYRYEPTVDWLRSAVDQLAAAYGGHRYTVIELIFAKPIENLRVYADAFRFRKDDSDG